MVELHQLTSQNWPHFGISEIKCWPQASSDWTIKKESNQGGTYVLLLDDSYRAGGNCKTMCVLAKGWPRTEAPGSLCWLSTRGLASD